MWMIDFVQPTCMLALVLRTTSGLMAYVDINMSIRISFLHLAGSKSGAGNATIRCYRS